MKFAKGTDVYVIYPNGTIREAKVICEQNSMSLRRLRLSMVVGAETKETVADDSAIVRKTEHTTQLADAANACRKAAELQLQHASRHIAAMYSDMVATETMPTPTSV